MAYDAATGAMVWVRRLADPAAGISYNATSVAVSRDGSAVFTSGYLANKVSPRWPTARESHRPQACRFWCIRPARGCSVQVSKRRQGLSTW